MGRVTAERKKRPFAGRTASVSYAVRPMLRTVIIGRKRYPADSELTPDDITALCSTCHELATTLRRFTRSGGSRFQFMARFKESIGKCDTESPSRVLADSSCTTARPDSTPGPLPTSKRRQIARKKGSNRTEADDDRLRELECQTSLWLDASRAPTIPAAAIRACIETAARKLKQGPQVREGLIVESVEEFDYDRTKGATAEELGKNVQFHGRGRRPA